MDRSEAFALALLVIPAVVAGCADESESPTSVVPTTTSASPTKPPAEQVGEIIDYFQGYLAVKLPTDARELRVDQPPLEDFRAAAVISFSAPRDDVIAQTCDSLGAHVSSIPPLLAGYPVKDMLASAKIAVNAADYESCKQYNSGRQIIVLIPNADGQPTHVLLYHLPYR